MKRITLLLTALFLLVSLFSCGSSKSNTEKAENEYENEISKSIEEYENEVSSNIESYESEINEAIGTLSPETTAQETTLIQSAGISPEFKAALDSYEEFFNKYIDFMKKYKENPGDITLLSEYSEMLTQYTDTMSKLEALQNEAVTTEDVAYYAEVYARILKNLSSVI